ncbi:MAG: methionine--tRNA ligase [Pseudomonadota bacterium]
MTDAKRFYITTAISYPNGAPHIGHAYEAMSTDALARFKKLDGYEVYFLTGTDVHGMKMLQAARAEGIEPAELADRNSDHFEDMVNALNCSNNDFIRTSQERHHLSSQEIWRRMEANGDIYLDKYAGWYSVRDEAYYDESELVKGENGEKLSPQNTPVEWVEEESYFFKLSAYQDKLLELYQSQPGFIGPDVRRNEVMSFVKRGLMDLSVSRTTFDWGVKVPGADGHVMYVWVDALTNYITGVGFPNEGDQDWAFWPADAHIIGKDIIRFHTVYWPAFLMSAGIALPKRVFAHGFLFNKGEKMSKSVGNVVDPFSLIKAYGLDQVRYFFMREVPFGQDGNYSHEAIVNRINADLANDLGNLAQRSLSMIFKNCEAQIPAPGAFSDQDKVLMDAADGLLKEVRIHHETQQLHKAIECIWQVVADANRYFAGQEPWALKTSDPERMGTVLYVTAETVRQVAILAQPYMPDSGAALLNALGVPEEARTFESLGEAGRLASGGAIDKPQAVFPRYVEPE